MSNRTLGLYVHIPFCLRKCLYCDFCSYAGQDGGLRSEYADAVIREIRQYAERARDCTVTSVYFGGGTPTLMPTAELSRILSQIGQSFTLSPAAEITLEANPKTVDAEHMAELRQIGFNRISIGVQSLCDSELLALGRLHTAEEAIETLTLAVRNFPRVSADLMYGIPEQTAESFERTLLRTLDTGVTHLSLYGLILEEGTPLYQRRAHLTLPDEETEYAMYLRAAEILSARGFSHYEISNYAKRGEECQHNLRYWRAQEYMGFGIAAHSYFGGVRYGNGQDLLTYLKNGVFAPKVSETLSDADLRFEYVMLALRLAEGIGESDYRRRFGADFWQTHRASLQKYADAGYVKRENGRVFLSDAGMYIENAILADIL